jgi:hypothetical protein
LGVSLSGLLVPITLRSVFFLDFPAAGELLFFDAAPGFRGLLAITIMFRI